MDPQQEASSSKQGDINATAEPNSDEAEKQEADAKRQAAVEAMAVAVEQEEETESEEEQEVKPQASDETANESITDASVEDKDEGGGDVDDEDEAKDETTDSATEPVQEPEPEAQPAEDTECKAQEEVGMEDQAQVQVATGVDANSESNMEVETEAAEEEKAAAGTVEAATAEAMSEVDLTTRETEYVFEPREPQEAPVEEDLPEEPQELFEFRMSIQQSDCGKIKSVHTKEETRDIFPSPHTVKVACNQKYTLVFHVLNAHVPFDSLIAVKVGTTEIELFQSTQAGEFMCEGIWDTSGLEVTGDGNRIQVPFRFAYLISGEKHCRETEFVLQMKVYPASQARKALASGVPLDCICCSFFDQSSRAVTCPTFL